MRLLVTFFRAIIVMCPWSIKRRILSRVYGYELHPRSSIGISWVFPQILVMREKSRIGHLTMIKGLDLVELDEYSTIGRLNWFSAYPSSGKEFFHDRKRNPNLKLGAHTSITHRHIIDCTDSVTVGKFSIVAGYRSQFLTHSVNVMNARQECLPISIGDYCFVGTGSILLPGSALPSFSILGAGSVLNKVFLETHTLYGGTPAKTVKPLDASIRFFSREVGRIT